MVALLVALGLVLAGAAIYQAAGVRRDARLHPPPGQLVDVPDGGRRHLHCRGRGRPQVIFEAGIAASSLSWTHVQKGVAEFTGTCSYDRAGLAWSEAHRGGISAASLAEELFALLRAASIRPPYVLAGHSFGAFIVRMFAARHPELVAGLVLVDPVYPAEWITMSADSRRRLAGAMVFSRVGAGLARFGVVRACLSLLSSGSTGVPRRVARIFGSDAVSVLTRLVGEVRKLPEETWPAVRSHWSQPKSFRSMARHLGSLRTSALEVAAIEAPTDIPITVITAASQPDVCRREHARLAALSTRGRHLVSETAGHWILLDEPHLVIRAIRDVVDAQRLPSTPGTPGTGATSGTRDG